MKKVAATAALAAAMVVGSATSASALWCQVADKKAGAGSGTMADLTVNKAGNLVYTGAFMTENGTDVFVRGGDKSHTEDTLGKQFGFAPETAECNGPEDHGVIDPWGVVCGEDGDH